MTSVPVAFPEQSDNEAFGVFDGRGTSACSYINDSESMPEWKPKQCIYTTDVASSAVILSRTFLLFLQIVEQLKPDDMTGCSLVQVSSWFFSFARGKCFWWYPSEFVFR
jgi:hypothetical protein